MTLSEFITNLNEFAEQNPDCLEMQVVVDTSYTDGSGSREITDSQIIKGYYQSGDFLQPGELPKRNANKLNAVCINY